MGKIILKENNKLKIVRSKYYNYFFNKKTGLFARWGKDKETDPEFSPIGPELVDMEISTVCSGLGKPCKFCYKSNTKKGKNMSLEVFKRVFDKLPKNVGQIAYGIGDIDSNPDMFKIFEYTRSKGVIPNVTINGCNLKDDYAKKLSKLCGAVAVSKYEPKDVCYDAVKKLTDLGMKQVNVHMLLSQETYDECLQLLEDIKNDDRLKNLNAVVFLTLKPKGRGKTYSVVKDISKYKKLIETALRDRIGIGFDSCSAPMFLQAMKNSKDYNKFEQFVEPCESTKFSLYIDCNGKAFPCSFLEGIITESAGNWCTGLDVLNCRDFMEEIWNHPLIKQFREKCVECTNNQIACPHYNLQDIKIKG